MVGEFKAVLLFCFVLCICMCICVCVGIKCLIRIKSNGHYELECLENGLELVEFDFMLIKFFLFYRMVWFGLVLVVTTLFCLERFMAVLFVFGGCVVDAFVHFSYTV